MTDFFSFFLAIIFESLIVCVKTCNRNRAREKETPSRRASEANQTGAEFAQVGRLKELLFDLFEQFVEVWRFNGCWHIEQCRVESAPDGRPVSGKKRTNGRKIEHGVVMEW